MPTVSSACRCSAARVVRRLRLRVLHLRLVHLFARQRAFLEQLLPAVEQFFRGVERFARGFDVRLRLCHLFRHAGAGGGAEVRLRLNELAAALLGGADEIGVLEFGEELARLDVIAAIDQEAPDRGADLGDDVRLFTRKQHRVRVDDDANASLDRRRHFHRRDRFGFRLGFLAADRDEAERGAAGESNDCRHDYSVPVSVCSAARATR